MLRGTDPKRARAWGGLNAAEAAPRRRGRWRSRGRRWRGPSARATERPCCLSAVPDPARRGALGTPLGRAPRPPATALRQRLAAPARAPQVPQAPRRYDRPAAHRQHPRCPGLTYALYLPPVRHGFQHHTCLPRSAAWRASWCHCCCPGASASRAKTSSLTSLTQSQRQPCMHAENRHHARHTGGEHRQRIKGAFAHPQRLRASLQPCRSP